MEKETLPNATAKEDPDGHKSTGNIARPNPNHSSVMNHDNGHIIELLNVSKEFDGKTVVEQFNLKIKKGEFVTFLGPSGCGKTTTLRMIAGFELPTAGKILLSGQDISHLPPYQRPVNTVFQRYALFPHLDVYGNVAFGLRLKKVLIKTLSSSGAMVEELRKYTEDEIDEKVLRALKIVDLDEFENRDVTTLSGGQQQRVAIARAIVNDPKILLLDEPLGALDLKMRKEMQIELKEMHRKLGITFIYVTHDQEEALTMSDTIIVMKDGRIQQVGTPAQIYNEPVNAYVANFIGESNIFNAISQGPKRIKFLNFTFDSDNDFPEGEKVDVVLRPEDIEIKPLGDGQIEATITNRIFKGVHYEYTCYVGKNECIIQDTKLFDVQSKVSLYIDPEYIHIMKRELDKNYYKDVYLNDRNQLLLDQGVFDVDVTQLLDQSKLDASGYLVSNKGIKFNLKNLKVNVEVSFPDVVIETEPQNGTVEAMVIQCIYKGDHYQIVLRTDDEEDFVSDSEYSYEVGNRVGIKIDAKKIRITTKADLMDYAA